jgi:AcrR family transcriptional regulator
LKRVFDWRFLLFTGVFQMETVTDDTRTKVLHAAGPVFAEKGFQAATVREICQEAGVNLASVNYHFRDKENLYLETVKHAHRYIAQLTPLPDWSQSTSPEVRLLGFVRTMLTRMLGRERPSWSTRLMMREVLEPTGACRALAEEYMKPHFKILSGILQEMLPADAPSHVRTKTAFSIIGQCLYYRVAAEVIGMIVPEEERTEHFQIDAIAEHIAGFTLRSLGRDEASHE